VPNFRTVLLCESCGDPFHVAYSARGDANSIACPYCGSASRSDIAGHLVVYQIAPRLKPIYRRFRHENGLGTADRIALAELPNPDG